MGRHPPNVSGREPTPPRRDKSRGYAFMVLRYLDAFGAALAVALLQHAFTSSGLRPAYHDPVDQ